MIIKKIRGVFHPEQFQGWAKSKNYFEGWYFKVVDEDETRAFAFIPGIAIKSSNEKHAFIQILDGKKRTAHYHKFEFETFKPNSDQFKIAIGNNHFSEQGLQLNLPGLKANLQFSENIPWPNHWYSPGIMGPYTFLPLMECYHGIVSMDHGITGQIEVDGEVFDFSNGRGYIEKDWGKSFPSAYVWIQTNHFSQSGISLKVSVARIPYLTYSFIGFIAGIWLGDRLIQFTTYNRSVLKKSLIEKEKVGIVMESKEFRLEILAQREVGTALASPILGMMDCRIEESMNARIEVNLIDRKSGLSIFNDVGRNAGLEVAGKIEEILIH